MQNCNDEKCFKHGHIKVRGNVFVGRIVSAKQQRTAVVEREITHFVPKYERYKKVKSRITVHNPDCINAKEGDVVRIGETRKLSKTKSFVIMGLESSAMEKKEKEKEESKNLETIKEKSKEKESKEKKAKKIEEAKETKDKEKKKTIEKEKTEKKGKTKENGEN